MTDMIRRIEELVHLPALSGYEGRVARYLADELRPVTHDIEFDRAGNVIGTIRGREAEAPQIMVFAHMDQLGLLVRKIEQSGLIRFERLGGIPEKVLPGTRVLIESEKGALIPGAVGLKAHHAVSAEEKYRVTPYSELYIDIGASSGETVREAGIEVGCPIVYAPCFQRWMGSRISATSIDDRAGCAVLLELAERLAADPPASTIQIVGSVQEEFNLRGACLAAASLKPDLAISIDLMVSGDTPDLEDRCELRLGGGPVLGMYSFHGRGTLNGTIPHPGLVRHFRETARANRIALQRSANLGSLTDSSYVQLVGSGIPCIDLGFPARYTHSPVESCDLSDLEALTELLTLGLLSIDSTFDLSRWEGREPQPG